MNLYALALSTCVLVVVFLLMLLRTRRIKEKYAAAWLLLSVAVCIVGAFPATIASVADFVGVETPSNLLFALAIAILFGVCIQLSVEISTLEEESRTLTEELAMLRLDVEVLAERCSEAAPEDRIPKDQA